MPTFTVEQVRAARAFLGWTQVDLGQAAKLSFQTIRNFETSRFLPHRQAMTQYAKRSKKLG